MSNPNEDEYWICGCVKRNAAGEPTHIKHIHRSIARCKKCGATRSNHDKIAAQMKAEKSD
jgi:hypothetical protein